MRTLFQTLSFGSAAVIHAFVVHALVALHASCAFKLCTSGQSPGGSRSDFIGRTVYHVMFMEYDALFWGLFARAPVPTDAPARILEAGAYPIGRAGACLPTDALTLGTLFLLVCVGYASLHAAVYGRRTRQGVSAFRASLSHASGWLLGVLSCGVSLALVLTTDPAALWPTRTGPFLTTTDIAICVGVAWVFYTLGVFSVEQHVCRWRAFVSRSLCRCRYDLSGTAHLRCPECGVDLGADGRRKNVAWRATRRYRLVLLALVVACAGTTGMLAWAFVPLRWQWKWYESSEYMVANRSTDDITWTTRRPARIPPHEWEAYLQAWRERQSSPRGP
jgi:hypothetical protein